MVGKTLTICDLHAYNVLANWYKASDRDAFSAGFVARWPVPKRTDCEQRGLSALSFAPPSQSAETLATKVAHVRLNASVSVSPPTRTTLPAHVVAHVVALIARVVSRLIL